MGDTGCRLTHYTQQGCHVEHEWPFRRIAAAALDQRPDLVIHVGDYHYREASCPDSRADCAGSPFGDNWRAWQQDLFAPARGLLAEVPWVFVRGNHEDCVRAGQGWHHFLAPEAAGGRAVEDCEEFTRPFAVDLFGADLPRGDRDPQPVLRLLVLDTAAGRVAEHLEDRYEAWKAEVADAFASLRPETPTWVVLHQPLHQPWRKKDGKEPPPPPKPLVHVDRLVQERSEQRMLVLGGDTHAFQAIPRAGTRDHLHVVAGHGGTALDALDKFETPEDVTWFGDDGVEIVRWEAAPYAYTMTFEHGFLVMTRSGRDSWTLEALDAWARTRVVCPIGSEAAVPGLPSGEGAEDEPDSVGELRRLAKDFRCVPQGMIERVAASRG